MSGLSLLKRVEPSRLFWPIFMVLSAFLAADITGRGIELWLIRSSPPGETLKLPDRQGRTRSLKDIVTPRSPAQTPSTPALPSPDFILIGTVVGQGTGSYAFFEGPKGEGQFMARRGEEIREDVFLKEVKRDSVVLLIGGREFYMPIGGGRAEGKAEERMASLAPPVTRVLNRYELEESFKDLNRLMSQARIIPYRVDGRPMGYRIFSISPGSIYSRIGLKNGDIVQRINGVELTSPDKVYLLFQQLRDESRVTIDILRAGRKMTIPVEIR